MPVVTTADWVIAALVVGVPVVFTLGRYSTRVTWFHARSQEKYSVSEFMRHRQ